MSLEYKKNATTRPYHLMLIGNVTLDHICIETHRGFNANMIKKL